MRYHESSAAVLQCSPRAVTLLKFLMEKAHNVTHSSFWRISKIIKECRFSRSTYHRAIRELVKSGFVTVKERTDYSGRQMSNEYIIHIDRLTESSNQGISAPKIKVSGYVRLTGMAYKIYLYLQAKCGRKGYCISRREIASACNVTLSTVTRYIKFLQEKGYIKCLPATKKNTGQGYNFYAVKTPSRIKIMRALSFISLLSHFFDTLPLITDDTPLTISKFKLNNSKGKRKLRRQLAYRMNLLLARIKKAKHRRMIRLE